MKLTEILSSFNGAGSIEELTEKFKNELAPAFLFGGYIKINDQYRQYRIYIRTVEFYYHEEEGVIKDPIVYHRNGKYPDRKHVPYFPMMSLHAHASGYDIAFENPKKKYRASALIRAYEIYDEQKRVFLKLSSKGSGTVDDRSTFLYDFLNGFAINDTINITWIDEQSQSSEIKQTNRRNVYAYDENEQKTKNRCNRQWSFTRTTDINIVKNHKKISPSTIH